MKFKLEIPDSLSLNGTQKNILSSILETYVEDLIDLPSPVEAIIALKYILRGMVHDKYLKAFEQAGVMENIGAIHKFLQHNNPQNRSESYPYVHPEEGYAIYKLPKDKIKLVREDKSIELKNGRSIPSENVIRNSDEDDYIIAKEEEGLLGLTAREDNVTPPVTKEAVVNYIYSEIGKRIEEKEKFLSSEQREELEQENKIFERFFARKMIGSHLENILNLPPLESVRALKFILNNEIKLLPLLNSKNTQSDIYYLDKLMACKPSEVAINFTERDKHYGISAKDIATFKVFAISPYKNEFVDFIISTVNKNIDEKKLMLTDAQLQELSQDDNLFNSWDSLISYLSSTRDIEFTKFCRENAVLVSDSLSNLEAKTKKDDIIDDIIFILRKYYMDPRYEGPPYRDEELEDIRNRLTNAIEIHKVDELTSTLNINVDRINEVSDIIKAHEENFIDRLRTQQRVY